jgi:4-aminobutyrate aminotransferase
MPSEEIDTFFFANSGSEAVEAAIKLARHYTGRTNTIVFQGSFHGRTIGAMSLTTSKVGYRMGYQPLMSGVFVAPFPYCYHCTTKPTTGGKYGDQINSKCCMEHPLVQLDLLFRQQTAPSETAAILIEPILGEGGYVPAPKSFMKELRKVCDQYGILLV